MHSEMTHISQLLHAAELPPWLSDWDDLDTITADEIAVALGRICRFAGRCPRWYSVARHSVLTMLLLPDDASPHLKAAALLHDAHEMFTGDLTRPAKRKIGDGLDTLTFLIDDWIHTQLAVPIFPNFVDTVRRVDDLALQLEIALLHKPASYVAATLPARTDIVDLLVTLGNPDKDAELWRSVWSEINA